MTFLQENNIYSQRMPPVIIVNIGQSPAGDAMTLRARDFSPTALANIPGSGGGPLPMHRQLRASIMAEAILNYRGRGRFHAFSAGSHPSGTVRPESLKQIELAGLSTEGLRSKSWDEFAAPDAPPIHFIFTVCDNAANEICPIWPGHPMTAYWGIPDPAAVRGTPEEIACAFRDAFSILDRRIGLFLALPLLPLRALLYSGNSTT
jgi:arsenate reductase